MSETLVSLHNVTIRYPDHSSFANINFEVVKGKHLVLVGSNEPLKSALLDALAGKVNIINGKKVFHFNNDQVAPQKLVAYVAMRHQFRNLSGMQDFYYQQRFNSMDSDNALTVYKYLSGIEHFGLLDTYSVENTIKQLKLDFLLNKALIKLSNGETKRVLIAAALLRNPVLLLLQNPFAGLDTTSRIEMKKLITKVTQSGVTVVMSASHNEIPDGIDYVVQVNTNEQIITVPKHLYGALMKPQPGNVVFDEFPVVALVSKNRIPGFSCIVKMKEVTIRYGDKIILDKINWEIKQGSCWALVGPNGAGKSTLLSLINGDNPQAFANNIILFDRKKGSGESIWDIKSKIGFFSPELYQYFPVETTCLQAVVSGFYDTMGLFKPLNKDYAAHALQWMQLLNVEQFASKMLRNVSAVNQRLCLLARALVKSPVLLILDEPCQGFDDQQAVAFKQIINTVCRNSNVTLIYVSHYEQDIPEVVTNYFRLDNGKQV